MAKTTGTNPLNTAISLAQAARLIRVNGTRKTYLVRGEPGIGKSSMLKTMAEPGRRQIYIDMTQMDIGDAQLPAINPESGTFGFLPNENFGVTTTSSEPVDIMLDEFGKANRTVQNVCLPILLERRVGNLRLHPDSRVFATSNLVTDGVHDDVQAHANNRFTHLVTRKPTNEEWLLWAMESGIHETILMGANENPQWFKSYLEEGQEDNPYIFNPKKPQVSFITPRTLELASHSLHTREVLGDEEALFADLAGTIGLRAAAELRAQIALGDKLPPLRHIIEDPKGCPLPVEMPSLTMLLFKMLARMDKDNFDPLFIYTARFPDELQCLFVNQMVKMPSKLTLLNRNPLFANWITKYAAIVA